MVVQHNLTAMNSSRQLGIVTNQQAKQSEKLSSGYRINRAGDDAAGLKISEKMRSQIRGLQKASTNAQDGVSLIQTAEGALNEAHSILQRMNELAVQGANDTNENIDRAAINEELTALTKELDRIAETTQFNKQNLLDGTYTGKKIQVGANAGQYISITITSMNAAAIGIGAAAATEDAGEAQYTNSALGLSTYATSDDLKAAYASNVLTSLGGTATLTMSGSYYKIGSDTYASQDYAGGSASVRAAAADAIAAGMTVSTVGGTTTTNTDKYTNSALGLSTYTTSDDLKAAYASNVLTSLGGTATLTMSGSYYKIGSDTYASQDYAGGSASVRAAAADAIAAGMTVSTVAGSAPATTATDGATVSTYEKASATITMIQNAINNVSNQRSALGALQNRLEHTIANLDNVAENTQAAESRIRDTDMAAEMVEYSKNQILAQAGQSMLAQANQATQGVLSLLQ